MVHSTGANNPNLNRYIGPDDGLLGKNQYNNHWNQDRPDGRQVCVHGLSGNWLTEASPHIRHCLGIIAAGTVEGHQMIHTSVLKFVRTNRCLVFYAVYQEAGGALCIPL